ncbi:MAG TPA: hypothetical protein DCY51_01730 [Bacteroidetes bacterium]|nr:hypothetical protein [Bacteroidota bacterium]
MGRSKSQWADYRSQILELYRNNPSLGYTEAARMLLGEDARRKDLDTLRTYITRYLQSISEDISITETVTETKGYDEPVDEDALKQFCIEEGIDYSQVESAKFITHLKGRKTFNVAMKPNVAEINAVDWDEIAEKFVKSLENVKPADIQVKRFANGVSLALYFSDEHVGLKVMPNNVYDIEYNEDIFNLRTDDAISFVKTMIETYPIDEILIAQMGDELDGYNGTTTRMTHPLPQNLGNEEQYDVWLAAKVKFFDAIAPLGTAMKFVGMANSNHSGKGFSYMAFRHLEAYLNVKYPHIDTMISRRFIQEYKFCDHTLLLTHGKDDSFMKFGWPLHADKKVDPIIRQYIDHKDIRGPIRLVKGDLHTSASDRKHKYTYRSALSFAGGSDYSMLNFDKSCPGLSYDIFMGEGQIMSGDYLFYS